MGEKLHVDAADRDLELIEPDGSAAPGVDQEFPLPRLDQRARAEAIGGIGTPVPSSVTRKSQPVMC
jgi:hypothetical protein